jgi:hypothetical protein
MPVSQYTNQFMRALPAALRPNPYNIDEYVMRAVENGWETDALAKACYINERNPNPAFVVTNVRNLCQHPQEQQTVRRAWNYGHIPCDEAWHPQECELCRCIPGEVTHHITVPASDTMSKPMGIIGRRVE